MTQTPAKILVVDDEAHIVHVVALKLRNAGYTVVTASDGEEALELAINELPDLVITDLQMPYLSGLQLCEKLRETKELAHVPAMMLTARGYSIAEEDLARTNIRAVLSKPFSPREVLERTKTMLAELIDEFPEADAA
ncbi:MAG: response regulator [Phycisphaerales bacterium]|nr:response regulator [Phycisphaerales bacterium]